MITEEAHDSNELEVPATLPATLPSDSDPVDLENHLEDPKEIPRKKAIRRRISVEQKELMVNFIIENPELITHSSTKENEIELWNELHQKLNDLKPEKSLDSWKSFLSRWRCQLLTKPEASMMAVDCRLKQFLNKIISNDQLPNSQVCSQVGSVKPANAPKQTIHDVLEKIIEVEKERSNLRLEIDNYELRINKYRFLVQALEREIELKRTRVKKLSDTKVYLNKRRRMFEKQENCVQPETEEKIESENENLQEQTEV